MEEDDGGILSVGLPGQPRRRWRIKEADEKQTMTPYP